MAKQKMTKAEREECERNLAVCQNAVASFQKMLADDDEADKAAAAESDAAAVKSIVAGGTGDARMATARGVLAIRERGGNLITDTVYRDRK